jgi:hypothetical protein
MAQAAQTEKNPKMLSRKPDANENTRRLRLARERKKANLEKYPRSAPVPEVAVPDPHANLRQRMRIVLNSGTKYSRHLHPDEVKMLGVCRTSQRSTAWIFNASRTSSTTPASDTQLSPTSPYPVVRSHSARTDAGYSYFYFPYLTRYP